MKAGRLIARVAIGGLFVGHGTQKLFGWSDGPGLDNAAKSTESLGLRPRKRNATAAAVAEAAGGAAIVAGAFTPLAAAALIGTMITAIRTVHLKNGFWAANGGYEFNLALIAALLPLVDGGPGELSVDGAPGHPRDRRRWAVSALAAGAAGSTAVIELGRRHDAVEPAPQPPATETATNETVSVV